MDVLLFQGLYLISMNFVASQNKFLIFMICPNFYLIDYQYQLK